jgi:hypothetical protein
VYIKHQHFKMSRNKSQAQMGAYIYFFPYITMMNAIYNISQHTIQDQMKPKKIMHTQNIMDPSP